MTSTPPFNFWARGPIRILTTSGLTFLAELDGPDASTVGRHWNAVRAYLETGHTYALSEFTGARVEGRDDTGTWTSAELETDPDAIDTFAWCGDVSFESIYDEVQ